MNRWVLLFALSVTGCVLEPVGFDDKRCPCADGYACDTATDRCVASAAETCDARVEDFGAAWSTARSIRWEWTPVGEPGDFVRYELEIAESADQLGTDEARRIGPEENPELGSYRLPRTGTSLDVVTATQSYGHRPGTTYVARLLVTDTSSCVFRSETRAFATTIEPPSGIVLYAGPAPEPGSATPTSLAIVDDGEGGLATEHRPSDDPECVDAGTGVCAQNIEWRNLAVDATEIDEGPFSLIATLEVDVTNDTDAPSFYSRIWLYVGDTKYDFQPFTAPPGRRRYEVPLRVLAHRPEGGEGTPLAHADLQADPIDRLNFGGQWSRCAPGETGECTEGRVLLHDVRIRY